jgi:hypothetical protein
VSRSGADVCRAASMRVLREAARGMLLVLMRRPAR